MNVVDLGLLIVIGCCAVTVLTGIPLALRKIPRNLAYGFRTRATLADDRVWFEANAHFGRGLIASAACGAFFAITIFVLQPFPIQLMLPMGLLALVIPSLVAVVATMRYVQALQKGGRDTGESDAAAR